MLPCFGRIVFRFDMVAQALARRKLFNAKPTLNDFWCVRDEFLCLSWFKKRINRKAFADV
jgi:hypothetical protein